MKTKKITLSGNGCFCGILKSKKQFSAKLYGSHVSWVEKGIMHVAVLKTPRFRGVCLDCGLTT